MMQPSNVILVFKSNIGSEQQAFALRHHLLMLQTVLKCSFDLQDTDKVVRIVATQNIENEVLATMSRLGITGEVM